VTGTSNQPTISSASGVWTLKDAEKYQRSGNWPLFYGASDTYFPYTTLLIHADGTNGANNSVFIDSSTIAATITRTGSTTQGTFTPFSSTGWSYYFPGTSTDYLTATVSAIGTNDFTIEFWFWPISPAFSIGASSFPTLFELGASQTSGNLGFWWHGSAFTIRTGGSAGGGDITYSTTGLTFGNWNHIAINRISGTYYVYYNGVLQSSTGNGGTIINSLTGTALSLGYSTGIGAGSVYQGYISNFRYTLGNAVYTTSFTPPIGALSSSTNTAILTAQTNRFIGTNTTSNNISITVNGTAAQVQTISPFNPPAAYSSTVQGGSFYLNGTSDYLTVPYNSNFDFVSGSSLSFEAWVYPTSYTNPIFLANRNWSYGGGGPTWGFKISSATSIDWSIAGTGVSTYELLLSSSLVAPYNIPLNAWSHVAFTRDSAGNNKIFVNGYLVAARTDSQTLASGSGAVYIGIPSSGGNYSQSYISNLRLVSNNIPTAYQTSSTTVGTQVFTPPTAPFTASSTANTTLLLNATNAGIIDNTQKNSLITYGTAAISTTQSKFGGSSIYFNGTSDYISALDSPNLRANAGNFTIEGWFYLTSLGAIRGIVAKGTNTTGWEVRVTAANVLAASYTSTALTGTSTIAINTWYHFALVRSGSATGNMKLYLNGSVEATSGGAVTDNFNGTDNLLVGNSRTANQFWIGYIDEVRLTIGYARYTSNFTPPVVPFLNN
jgi:hypothetical protein